VAIGTIGHFFNVRRGFATGIASCAGSLGGIFFTLMLSSLFTSAGFAWATRALGFIFAFLLVMANLLVRSRPPGKPISRSNILPDFRIFKDQTFLLMTIALFLIEWGLFIGLSYITSFALANGIRPALAYQLISILNAGSFFGRWAPGLLADKIGRFNTMILMIFLCMITTLGLWLPAALTSSPAPREGLLIAFALLFGFASGSNITLGPVCAGQLCKTENYGKYFATCYTLVGVGTLVGIPIGGEILARAGGDYVGLIAFGGGCYAFGLIFFVWARVRAVGWGLRKANIF
jgi:nitrate/nitrite transporter NarK